MGRIARRLDGDARLVDPSRQLAAGNQRIIGAANAFEHVESYLKPFFNFIGIEPEFVRANGVNVARDEGIAGGLAEVEALAA